MTVPEEWVNEAGYNLVPKNSVVETAICISIKLCSSNLLLVSIATFSFLLSLLCMTGLECFSALSRAQLRRLQGIRCVLRAEPYNAQHEDVSSRFSKISSSFGRFFTLCSKQSL